MNKVRRKLGLLGLTFALLLASTYMAFFYAPIPPMGVKVADSLAGESIGQQIQVVGFVYGIQNATTVPSSFWLADNIDYLRWQDHRSGLLGADWWSVRPIHVVLGSGGDQVALTEGVNVSVSGHFSRTEANGTVNMNVPRDSQHIQTNVDITRIGVFSAPLSQKIFYFHMPSAWVAYVAFGVTLVGSAMFLWKRSEVHDRIAGYSAELGVVFATIAIITGPIWAKEEWGVYWRWDDTKLVATFILWIVFFGYLVLRATVQDEGKMRRISAIYGMLAFVTVPLSFLASRVMQSFHPTVIGSTGGGLSADAGFTVIVAIAAFTCLYLSLLWLRYSQGEMEKELESIKKEIGGED